MVGLIMSPLRGLIKICLAYGYNHSIPSGLKQIRDYEHYSIPVPFPPVEEQEKILRGINVLRAETQKLKTLYQRKIAALDELKKSILQKAFTGELDASTSSAITEKSRRDDKIIENKINHPQPNPEGVI